MPEYNLPEFIATPRGGYFIYTGEESSKPDYRTFREAKRQETKVNAVNKALALDGPIVPRVPNRPARIFRRAFGDWYDDNDAIFIFGAEKNPNSCIYTQTSLYGHPETRNTEFKKNPEKYGFVQTDTPGIGTLVLLDNHKGTPHHMMIVSGFDEFGKPVLTYPQGGPSDPYIKDNDWFWDENTEPFRYYNFVGNSEDEKAWIKEYNTLHGKTNSPNK